MDCECFQPELEALRDKERKSNANRKPFDMVLMFKVLVLQSLYNFSDEKTIWLFQEQLTDAKVIERFSKEFDESLEEIRIFCPERPNYQR